MHEPGRDARGAEEGAQGRVKKVRIIHETNPRKYFGAVFLLHEQRAVKIVGAHRYSIFKETLRSVLRESVSFEDRCQRVLSDLVLKCQLPFIKNETIILAIAPWDWRIVYFYHLARRNRVIYQTSWPDWRLRSVPRRYLALEYGLKVIWKRFLAKPSVVPVTIQRAAAESILAEMGTDATVLPHAVDDFFFAEPKIEEPSDETFSTGVRLLFVGELSEKKGVLQCIEIAESLAHQDVHLTVVGDGPLRNACVSAAERCANIDYIGKISDRSELASTVRSQDILLVLSRRTETWEELFGIVIVEALAAGLAVIASDHVGPREILGDNSDGLFDQYDTSAVQSCIARLANDPVRLENFKAGQRGIADRFHIENIARSWLKLL